MFEDRSDDELAELADENDVKIDRRWKRERIVAALSDAGVVDPDHEEKFELPEEDEDEEFVLPEADEEPDFVLPEVDEEQVEEVKKENEKSPEQRKKRNGPSLSEKVDKEAVQFYGSVGSIRVRDSRFERDGDAGRFLKPGLLVQFFDGAGEPVGGMSRPFYPDNDEHEEREDCDCGECLEAVRKYLKEHRHGKQIAEANKISEVSVNDPTLPTTGWDRISGQDVEFLHQRLGFDVANAMRFEKKHFKRQDVIDALNDIDEDEEKVEDKDILNAEVEVG